MILIVVGISASILANIVYTGFHPEDTKRSSIYLYALVVIILGMVATERTLKLLAYALPLKLDAYAYHIDALMGEPAFATGKFLLAHPWLRQLAFTAYDALPFAMLAAFAANLWLEGGAWSKAATAFTINLVLAVPIYTVFPVCGPAFAVPSFPELPSSMILAPMHILAPPNGIPSVHASTALLIVLLCWRWPKARIPALAYLALIVLSTMGCGQHYAIDLIAAVPYTLLVWWLTPYYCPSARRSKEYVAEAA